MKWYEKQKNIYAAKNEHDQHVDEPVIEGADTIMNEETEPVETVNSVNQPIPSEPELKTLEVTAEYSQEVYMPSAFEKTVIGRGAVVSGDIECAGDLQFHGSIHGNITCHGFLEMAGAEVTGNVTCDHMQIEDVVINGDIVCSEEMSVMKNAVINGNIQTYDLENCGQIVGTVTAEHYVHMSSSGSIRGDVITEDIEIARGANLQGLITMKQ